MSGSTRHEGDPDVITVEKTEKKVARPPMYKVLLHNDDFTTMEFVVAILQHVFHRSEADAVRIMLHVHKLGIGVAGVYTFEIAETRVAKVMSLAKEAGFPLLCTLEPEQ